MIKNIIFDLGAVVLNIDFQRTLDAFRKLGISNIEEVFTGYTQHQFFDDFEKGHISPAQFREELRKLINNDITDEIIDEAWNTMLLDFPAERINLLLSCKSKYRTFLLSNTNAIHFPIYNQQLKDKFHIENLSDLFEKAYYSYRVGMRKPDQEIFELVLTENQLNPLETVFIDDSAQHIETAKKLGLQTIHLLPPKTVLDAVSEIEKY